MFKAALNRVTRSYPGRLIATFGASQAGNYASGLAFTAFLSMFPLILGLLAIIGVATQSHEARSSFLAASLGFFPADARPALITALDGIRRHSGLFGVIGVLGLLWSGSSLFTAMEFALGKVLGSHQRDFARQRLMALVMTFVFVASVVATILVNSVVGLAGAATYLDPLVGLAVWCGFMTAVYRLVPNRTFHLRQLWPGILLAGSLMEVLTLIWPIYTRTTHGFSTYGAALALFFLLASWLYFLAQFILLGAVANRMHAGDARVGGLLAGPDRADQKIREPGV